MARPDLRLLVPSLLRPIGVHLVAMLQSQPGDLCVDVGGTASVMAILLARTAREVVVVAESPDVLGAVRDEAALLHLGNVIPVLQRTDALSMPDRIVQVVTSLFAPITAETLRELRRVLDPQRGRMACAIAVELPGLRLGSAQPDALGNSVIRDVARFDGEAHYRAATGADQSVNLDQYTAFDGSIRIPVEVTVLTAGLNR
jgi:hypothetical protein